MKRRDVLIVLAVVAWVLSGQDALAGLRQFMLMGAGPAVISAQATAWGTITGTLASQTDLQAALNSKQAAGSYATGTGTANGTNTGDQTSVSGNAGTATTLQTARTINGVSFNGSANITIPAATYVVTTADTTNATTSYANITGLSWTVNASTRYRVSCLLPYDANATTTGIGIGWTGPASPTLTRGLMTSGLTTATTGGTTSVGNDTGATTTASVGTTGNIAHFEGIWSNGGTGGTLQLRVKSEVAIANAIIVRTGAQCSYATY